MGRQSSCGLAEASTESHLAASNRERKRVVSRHQCDSIESVDDGNVVVVALVDSTNDDDDDETIK